VLGNLSLRRRIFVLVVAALVAAIVVSAWIVTRPEPLDESFVPVILVHGYGGTPASMRSIRSVLELAGRRVTAVELPARGTADLMDSARAVAQAVEETRAAHVDFVGYSVGGIVVRSYLEDLGGMERARRVVLLGAPNHGAQVAAVATAADPASCVDACAQLAPGSSFLEQLNDDETPAGPHFVSIWTADDRVVTPPDSAVLDGAVNVRLQDVCPDALIEHGDLVRYPLPLALVMTALGTGLDRAPGPARCEALRALGEDVLSS
jgi:triacylglycerol lipase